MMRHRTARRLGIGVGVLAVAIAALVFFWRWDWFIPIADRYASSSLGRKVSIGHLHVRLGRVTRVQADDVVIADRDGFPTDRPLLRLGSGVVSADVWAYVRHGQIVVPLVALDRPDIYVEQKADGQANWQFGNKSDTSDKTTSKKSSSTPQIGDLRINDGKLQVVIAKLGADLQLAVRTEDGKSGADGRIVVDAHGLYAKQKLTGNFVGGSLLTLRDATKPYPADLHLANGPTKLALTGTVNDPIKFAGAKLKLDLSGPDMSLLYALTGVPIPETPAYDIAGRFDYADRKFKFQDFTGHVGSSDLNGDIDVDPTGAKTMVDADLNSHLVDLTDLAGFIGAPPGRDSTPASPAQKQELKRKEKTGRFLPDQPINLPKVEAANVHLRYRGDKIRGKYIPLDNIVVALDIDDGRIRLHPLQFKVGTGDIVGNIDLTPHGNTVHAVAKVDFRRVDLSRIMQATHLFHGQGIIGGGIELNTDGNSIASFLGDGNGGVQIVIQGGGDISALLADLAGLQFGDALLSAIGIPRRANLECFVADLPLRHGDLDTKVFLLDTSETRIQATGSADLKTERLDYTLVPQARHFSIGSLPTPIDIGGTFKDPSIHPHIAPLAVRGGAAAALGVLFPPLALLATVQTGVDDQGACSKALRMVRTDEPRHGKSHR